MQAVVKGFSIFYFVMLPVFYAEKRIDSTQVGYIGALFIAMLIIGALSVAKWLHNLETKKLLQLSALLAIVMSITLLTSTFFNNIYLLIFSYTFMGLAVGTAISGVKVVAADVTVKGDRYKSLAQLHMFTDLIRITFPLIVSACILLGASSAAIFLIIFTAAAFFLLTLNISSVTTQEVQTSLNIESVKKNKNFLYLLFIEFLDSLSSSQLFVFLPLLFLAKGHSLQSSLLLQSFIFIGYISGRWLIGLLSKKYSGLKTIGYAEICMVIAILIILFVNNIFILYFLSFALGMFARGTSPAIEALTFDSLEENQIKKGTAIHIAVGDSGSALGQLFFGLLVAWYGVTAPFLVAAVIALFAGVLCLIKPIKVMH